MGRLSDILTRARFSLSDVNKERWKDLNLLALLDEGQKEIAFYAELLRVKYNLPIQLDTSDYTLPEDCTNILRIISEGKALPLKSHLEMDGEFSSSTPLAPSTDWEADVKPRPEAVIFDNLNPRSFKIYPIPNEHPVPLWNYVSAHSESWNSVILSGVGSLKRFGLVVSSSVPADSFSGTSPWGVISDISYGVNPETGEEEFAGVYYEDASAGDVWGFTSAIVDILQVLETVDTAFGIIAGATGYDMNSSFGCITDASDATENRFVNVSEIEDVIDSSGNLIEDGVRGVGVTLEEESKDLTIYYVKRPATLLTINNVLEIDQTWDTLLKWYVIGNALKDDKDTQKLALGERYLQMFAQGLQEAVDSRRNNFMATGNQYNVPYVGGV